MKDSKNQKKQFISPVIIIAAVFGFMAGVVGQIVADVYIHPTYFDDRLVIGEDTTLNIPELRAVKKILGTEKDFAVEQSVKKVSSSLVSFYEKKSSSGTSLDTFYLKNELLGSGFVLTSDGWLATHSGVISDFKLEDMVIMHDHKEYVADMIVFDPTTDVVFVKISGSNLPVVTLGDSDQSFSGQTVLLVNSLLEVGVSNITNTMYQNQSSIGDIVISSEQYSGKILLDTSFVNNYVGAPLLNLSGEVTGVVGVSNLNTTATALNQFRPVLLNIFRDGITKRPYLGIEYIDLSHVAGFSQDQTQGALVYREPSRNTPASIAGLKVNDIIISIDNQPVDTQNSLTSIIQQYQPGDEVVFEIIRGKQQILVTIRLALSPE